MAVGEIPGLVVERDVPVKMRDGTILSADIYRPGEDDSYPVIVMRLPYDKTQAQVNTYAHPAWYAQQGYIVVVQDTRGRWSSEGEFYPFQDESNDTYDTVEWAAALPGSNGRVGMYGFSYAGATQLLGAVARPPHLACICPALTGSQYYDGWAYNGGAFALAFNLSWAARLAMDTSRRKGHDRLEQDLWNIFLNASSYARSMPLSSFEPLSREDIAPFYFDWLEHPDYDDYWRRWSIDERYDRVATPALHVAGWYDIFRDGNIKNFQGLREQAETNEARQGQKLIIGPWYHAPWAETVGQIDFGADARNFIDDVQLRWFDYWLKSDPNGLLDEPPVSAFIMGDNRWETFSDWPPPGVEYQTIYLHSHGRANSLNGDGTLSCDKPADEPYDIYTYDPQTPVPSLGGHSCCNFTVSPMGPQDQRAVENMNSVLVYTSDLIDQELLVAGPVSVDLWFSTSVVDTDFTAKLVDVFPDKRAINLTEGIVRTRYRDSLESPSLIQPHQVYGITIELGNTCNLFKQGHRIRLEVSSSNFPHWDRNSNSGNLISRDTFADFVVATQVVFHDANRPSCLRLPVLRR